MQTIGIISGTLVSWFHDGAIERSGYDTGTVQGPADGGDFGAALRGGCAGDRDAGEDRFRRVPGPLQVALRAHLVHRLRARGRPGESPGGPDCGLSPAPSVLGR